MASGTIPSIAEAGLFDAACIPWVPIALVIALAAVAVIGAFVLRRDPSDGDDETDPEM
ncbi:hypothetical protein [Schumannella soli]|uniref:hypothetical protein n=1 Tax=Schumannella soli TaxID=2590779 RepID=UPI0015E84CFB|nr:hypothetical protein [Schumannella soli]